MDHPLPAARPERGAMEQRHFDVLEQRIQQEEHDAGAHEVRGRADPPEVQPGECRHQGRDRGDRDREDVDPSQRAPVEEPHHPDPFVQRSDLVERQREEDHRDAKPARVKAALAACPIDLPGDDRRDGDREQEHRRVPGSDDVLGGEVPLHENMAGEPLEPGRQVRQAGPQQHEEDGAGAKAQVDAHKSGEKASGARTVQLDPEIRPCHAARLATLLP